ncbi:MAG TPA: Fic/DOC family N-terminal domain-containing protein, partial [Acidimicrobiales bacterium]
MSKVVQQHWPEAPRSGLARRDRMGCDYEAYIPDVLTGRELRLDGDVAAEVADAEAAVARLNAEADTEALARLLLRTESVASSYIEGLQIGGRRLLRAEAALL